VGEKRPVAIGPDELDGLIHDEVRRVQVRRHVRVEEIPRRRVKHPRRRRAVAVVHAVAPAVPVLGHERPHVLRRALGQPVEVTPPVAVGDGEVRLEAVLVLERIGGRRQRAGRGHPRRGQERRDVDHLVVALELVPGVAFRREVQLAEHPRAIPGPAERLGQGDLVGRQDAHARDAERPRIPPRVDGCARGHAHRADRERPLKRHPVGRKPIKRGRPHDRVAHAPQRIGAMLVGHDQYDVRLTVTHDALQSTVHGLHAGEKKRLHPQITQIAQIVEEEEEET
jgi:hypothetical protein